jgi:hypothetical protein
VQPLQRHLQHPVPHLEALRLVRVSVYHFEISRLAIAGLSAALTATAVISKLICQIIRMLIIFVLYSRRLMLQVASRMNKLSTPVHN